MCLRLSGFQSGHASAILDWPRDALEMSAWAGVDAPFPATADLFDRWHADPDVQPLLLFDGRDLVGYAEIWMDRVDREIELGRVIVAPPRRVRGVGRQFVRLLLDRAATFGFEDVFARVVPENRAAIRCYEAAGFDRVPAGDEQRYNRGQPRSYVWMRYCLNAPHNGIA